MFFLSNKLSKKVNLSILSLLFSSPLFAELGTVGTDDYKAADFELSVDATYSFSSSGHAIAGTAMRTKTDGVISLRGVPSDGVVTRAYLYFNMQDSASAKNTIPILFNGNRKNAQLVASNVDLCWGSAGGNHTYRATVTNFMPAKAPNQDYSVAIDFGNKTVTSGVSPWGGTDNTIDFVNGATLVVVYRDSSGGYVNIYDDFTGGAMLGSNGTFVLDSANLYASSATKFSLAGADGQRTSQPEKSYFNGTQIAGSGASTSASDWDGTAGWPAIQLFDVVTHDVTTSGSGEVVSYEVPGDCVAPVVMVLDQ